ncbi:uncharacterized protein K452DRAFT_293387, partial [Aplosporella prunicola CBS 121167]
MGLDGIDKRVGGRGFSGLVWSGLAWPGLAWSAQVFSGPIQSGQVEHSHSFGPSLTHYRAQCRSCRVVRAGDRMVCNMDLSAS